MDSLQHPWPLPTGRSGIQKGGGQAKRQSERPEVTVEDQQQAGLEVSPLNS